MVTIYSGQEYWEFTLEPDETITFIYEKNGETVIYEKERTSQLEDLRLSSIHT